MLKLSEIKGEKSIDILADLVDPVANIAGDPDAALLFGKRDLPEGMSVKEYIISRLRKSIPKLLKGHKKDLVKILAALSDMTEEEYSEQLTLDGLIVDLSSLMTDQLFNAFFTTQPSIDQSSGDASETIKD